MKPVLKGSILLNLGLLSALVWILAGERKPASDSVAPVSQHGADQPATVAPAAEAPVVTRVDAAPFNWTRIESDDYRVYIKNLRAIGCPEQTVRDIITADVDSLYKARGRQLRQKLTALANGPWSARLGSQSALEAELRRLPGEEEALIAELLGPQTAPLAEAAPAPAPAPRLRPSAEKSTSMPLVFANVDLASLHLDESRIQAISSLQQRFIQAVGGPDQDPNNPAYRERWQKAQPEIDNMLKGMIGINAFQQYDLTARISLQSGTDRRP
jgi:hypothetical protein